MEAHVGDKIIVRSTHQGEAERTGEVIGCHEPDGGPPYRVRWEPTATKACSSRQGTADRRPRWNLSRLRGRTDGEGHRHGAGTAVRGQSAQRGPRRPRGGGEDHPGRGAPRRDRGAAPRRTRRGRHDLPGHRGGGGPAAALGVTRRRDRRARRTPHHPARHPRLAGLRRRAAGRPARRRRRAVRRLRRQRGRRQHRAAVGGVRRGRHAARRRHHPARPGPCRRRGRPSGSARPCSATGVYPVHLVERGPDGAVRGLVSLLEPGADAPDADRLRSELIEGIIGESEDEALMERYLAGDELVQGDLISRPRDGGGPRPLPPGPGRRPADRRRHRLDLLELLVAGFPCPMEHGCPPVTRPDGGAAPATRLRPRRSAGRRGREDDHRPLPRPGLAWSGSSPARCGRTSRSTSPATAWPSAATPTTTSTSGSARSPRRWARTLRPVAVVPGRRHLRRRPARQRRDRRHAVLPGRPAPDAAVGTADAAAPRRGRGGVAGRRGPAGDGAGAAGRRGPDRAAGAASRHRPAAAVVRGGGPRRGAARAAAQPARRRRHHRSGARADGRDARRQRPGHRPARQAVRRARAVRRRRGGGPSPAPPGSGVVFEQRIVGGTVPSQFHGSVEKGIRTQAAARGQRRPADRRRARDARRRQGALGRLLRRRLPGRRGAGAARAGAPPRARRCSSRGARSRCSCPAEYVGAVMSDLSGRRARVTGSEADPDRDRTTVRAEVPEVELLTYPGVLRSVTHGTGSFDRRPLGYEPAPAHLAVPA